jgi:hypothetical protein
VNEREAKLREDLAAALGKIAATDAAASAAASAAAAASAMAATAAVMTATAAAAAKDAKKAVAKDKADAARVKRLAENNAVDPKDRVICRGVHTTRHLNSVLPSEGIPNSLNKLHEFQMVLTGKLLEKRPNLCNLTKLASALEAPSELITCDLLDNNTATVKSSMDMVLPLQAAFKAEGGGAPKELFERDKELFDALAANFELTGMVCDMDVMLFRLQQVIYVKNTAVEHARERDRLMNEGLDWSYEHRLQKAHDANKQLLAQVAKMTQDKELAEKDAVEAAKESRACQVKMARTIKTTKGELAHLAYCNYTQHIHIGHLHTCLAATWQRTSATPP